MSSHQSKGSFFEYNIGTIAGQICDITPSGSKHGSTRVLSKWNLITCGSDSFKMECGSAIECEDTKRRQPVQLAVFFSTIHNGRMYGKSEH